MQPSELPAGWQTALDPRYQRWYYFSPSTGVTQWEPPNAATSAASAIAVAPSTTYSVAHALITGGNHVNGQATHSNSNHAAAAPLLTAQQSDPAASATATATADATSAPASAVAATPVHSSKGPFWYYDPQGQLLGPFSLQQMTAWRAYLPMDLLLLLKPPSGSSRCDRQQQQQQQDVVMDEEQQRQQQHRDSNAVQQQQQHDDKESTRLQQVQQDPDHDQQQQQPGEQNEQQQQQLSDGILPGNGHPDLSIDRRQQQQHTAPAMEVHETGQLSPQQQQQQQLIAVAADQPVQENQQQTLDGTPNGKPEQSQQQQQLDDKLEQRQQALDIAPNGTAEKEQQQQAADRVPNSTQQQQQQLNSDLGSLQKQQPRVKANEAEATGDLKDTRTDSSRSSSSSTVVLAGLLCDTHLLSAWISTQQQQQQQQWPPKAVAPPAPVVEAWYNSYNSSSSALPAAAAAAVANAADHQQQQQQQQKVDWQAHFPVTAAAAANGSKVSSGFNRYAAAALQGLPADDEAVQLAKLAAAHGYSLQDLLQQQQRNGPPNAPAAAAAKKGGMIDPRQLPGVMLTKDPRSGRLTAAGSSSGSDAVGLYGDLMRWCDPAGLESQLAKRATKKQRV